LPVHDAFKINSPGQIVSCILKSCNYRNKRNAEDQKLQQQTKMTVLEPAAHISCSKIMNQNCHPQNPDS
jgi:hypothetical protein